MDRHTKQQRSYNMSQIKGSNTKPEVILRKRLFGEGYRYRINDKKLPGKPDLVLKKYKTIIFVNGCFWHGHPGCKYFVIPKTRTEFWMNKIDGTRKRDRENEQKLKAMGWNVLTVWECELKNNTFEETVNSIMKSMQLSTKTD